MVQIRISDDIKQTFKGISIGSSLIKNANTVERCNELDEEIRRVEFWVKRNFTLEELKNHPVIRAYRDFYWKIKIDPTKQRPSAEALIRRILRGKSIPRINCAVDAYNLASILTQISIGAYDYDRIVEPLMLRWSRDGEEFWPIGGEKKTIRKQPVIADSKKIINLYPHRDSELTKITNETRNILVIACGVPGIPNNKVVEASEMAAKYIAKYCGGEVVEVNLVI